MNIIITYQDAERFPILGAESQECSVPISTVDLEQIEKMDAVLRELDENAAGLAAVQIGYPRRIFLLRQDGQNRAFINPIIVGQSKEVRRRPEACLSLPGLVVRTERPKSVTIKYSDLGGLLHTETFVDFWAQCVMHEMDHLNGRLLSQHMQEQYAAQPVRKKFGMKVNPTNTKRIEKRRKKNKAARKMRKSHR